MMFFVIAFWLFLTAPAFAEPLTVALFGTAFAATFGGTVVTGLFYIAGSIALNYISGLFFQKDKQDRAETKVRDPQQVVYGERVARNGVYGRRRIAGHRAHVNEFSNATKLQLVHILADAWCEELSSIYVNGRQCTLVSETVSGTEHKRYSVSEFGSLIDIRFHDGRSGQAADTELVAQTSGWDSTKKFSGQCYAAITITSDREKFGNRIPDFEFVLKGQRVYDIRLDTTAGGSGSHRFDDPTTWEYSANPFVCAYHHLRGFHFNSERILGAELSSADLDTATFIAAMNTADETVTEPDEVTTRNRYEAHLFFEDTTDHHEVLRQLCDAAGGFYAEKQGKIAVFAGEARSTALTITDDDLIRDEKVVFSPKKPGSVLFTGVQGVYTNPNNFISAHYATLEPSAYVTSDGRSRIQVLDFPQIENSHQAYLVAKQFLLANRIQGTAAITLDIKDTLVEIGDWIRWNSANSLRGDRTYRVVGTSHNFKTMRMGLQLEEVSSTAYADDATVSDVTETNNTFVVAGYLTNVSNLAIIPQTLISPSGNRLPGLKFTYDAIVDPAVSAVIIEYRIKGETETFRVRDPSPQDGTFYTSSNVSPNQLYEARAILDTIPGRDIQTDPSFVDASANTVEITITAESFEDAVNDLRNDTLKRLMEIEERLLSFDTAVTAETVSNRQELVAKFGKAAALVSQEATARADQFGSLATSVSSVVASYDEVSASGLFSMQAQAAPDGWDARITMAVRADVEDSFVLTAISLDAKSNGERQIVLDADNVVFTGRAVSVDGSSFFDFDDGSIRSATSS